MVAAAVRPPRAPRWSGKDAWLITYPDQFGPSGLAGVGEVVRALGPEINGVHVLPFHPSSSDGGFSVMDYATVDPAVGSWADVEALAGETRLMADAVVNHVSARGEWFRAHLAGDPALAGYFRVVPPGADLASVVRPRPGPPVSSFTRDDGSVIDYWTTFSADQIDLDYREPSVLLAVCEAVFRYVTAGAAAVRLDAVAFLWKDPATASIHLPQTHTIVAILRDCLAEIDPGVVLVTETNVAHEDNVAYLGTPAVPEAHAVYQFSLAPLVLHALQTGDTAPLEAWISTSSSPPDTTVLNFLASHDGVGVRPAAGWLEGSQIAGLAARCREAGGVVNMAAGADGDEPYELAATWRSLCEQGPGAPFGDDELAARIVAGHAVAFALAGIPLLYVHSLVGSINDLERADRTGVARELNRGRFATPAAYLALVDDDPVAARVWPRLREMLRCRGSSAAFHPASPQRLLASPPGVVAVRRGSDTDAALVVVNLSDRARPVTVGRRWIDALVDAPVDEVVEIGPWGVSWLHGGPGAGLSAS